MTDPLIQLRAVAKTYPASAGQFTALQGIDLTVESGEFLVVVGQSGSGKSTLLNLLAGIDRPSTGEIEIGGERLDRMSEKELTRWRGRGVGIVFQFFQLLPTLTAAENIMLPMDFCARWPKAERRPRALALLDRLGVADQADKFPVALSGGQQQRVAVARALANAPALLLADEPTGNLDSRNAANLLDLLAELRAQGQTVVMVTHDGLVAQRAGRHLNLVDGHIAHDSARRHVG